MQHMIGLMEDVRYLTAAAACQGHLRARPNALWWFNDDRDLGAMPEQTILVVDDEPANIDVLVECLKANFNVKAATVAERPCASPAPWIRQT
jgi:PleD family two-component response regulator